MHKNCVIQTTIVSGYDAFVKAFSSTRFTRYSSAINGLCTRVCVVSRTCIRERERRRLHGQDEDGECVSAL